MSVCVCIDRGSNVSTKQKKKKKNKEVMYAVLFDCVIQHAHKAKKKKEENPNNICCFIKMQLMLILSICHFTFLHFSFYK